MHPFIWLKLSLNSHKALWVHVASKVQSIKLSKVSLGRHYELGKMGKNTRKIKEVLSITTPIVNEPIIIFVSNLHEIVSISKSSYIEYRHPYSLRRDIWEVTTKSNTRVDMTMPFIPDSKPHLVNSKAAETRLKSPDFCNMMRNLGITSALTQGCAACPGRCETLLKNSRIGSWAC